MKRFVILTFFAPMVTLQAEDKDIYGNDGKYKGYVDEGGEIYGDDGKYKGYADD